MHHIVQLLRCLNVRLSLLDRVVMRFCEPSIAAANSVFGVKCTTGSGVSWISAVQLRTSQAYFIDYAQHGACQRVQHVLARFGCVIRKVFSVYIKSK